MLIRRIDMTSKKLSLENFVYWLIIAQPEDKFCYRYKICDTVKIFGKDIVLNELKKQSYNFKNVYEAVNLTKLLREII